MDAKISDTVTWINNDIVTHDVTEVATGAWTSGVMPPGKSWSLDVAGSSNYYGSIHMLMNGKIHVQ